LRTDEAQTITKLPLLGDIPLVGRAFRHKDKVKTERELLIFITPSIVDENNKSKLSSNQGQSLTREQEVPKTRAKQISKELSSMEQQNY
jgi:type II secretory pathway component GspD/PulD (secretin)